MAEQTTAEIRWLIYDVWLRYDNWLIYDDSVEAVAGRWWLRCDG